MSMLSAQRDELRKCADALQDAIDNLNSGRITYKGLTDAMYYGINDLRSAADTIWELRNKLCDMVDARERVRMLEPENAKLRELVNDMWICISHGSEGWDCTGCRRDSDSVCIRGISEFSQRMRELGIEVPS